MGSVCPVVVLAAVAARLNSLRGSYTGAVGKCIELSSAIEVDVHRDCLNKSGSNAVGKYSVDMLAYRVNDVGINNRENGRVQAIISHLPTQVSTLPALW